jgi:putative copper export protein
MDAINRWAHMVGLVTYLGTTLGLVVVLLPMAMRIEDPAEQRRMVTKWLSPYNLLSVGSLLVLLISGGNGVTDLKAALGPRFTALFGWLLLKLSLSFLLIFTATWLSFGLGHRLVRAERAQFPVEPELQRSILMRLRGGSWFALGLAAVTAWVGTWFRG